MISAQEMELYDDTPLLLEELTEEYYLDRRDGIAKPLSEEMKHPTKLKEKMPEDFLYSVDTDVLDLESYEWKLTYQFSSNFRDPYQQGIGQYGSPNLSFRRLYIILCEHFNHAYFIDDYFINVYPSTMKETVETRLENTKKAFLELVEEAIQQTRITKDNKLDMRYKMNRELNEWSDTIADEEADELARMVKEDIKNSLASGRIPLKFNLSDNTMKIRRELGISSNKEFFATEQLIDDLRIFFSLEKKGWQTKQGIMV